MKKSNAKGVILYHGLGSGKTITSIAISQLYDRKVIVIVPASMRTQWDTELNKMGVEVKNYKVISYEGFLSLVKSGDIKTLKNKVVIVDEAHRIRSATGKISNTIVSLLQTAYKKILLTGTPMVNGPVDLSPLINAIEGENILPVSEKEFKEKFYILQNKSVPRLENRCRLFSAVGCTDRGIKYKKNLCKYHYVRSLRRKRKKLLTKEDLDGLEDIKEWRKKQLIRIEHARAIFRNAVLKPNISEYTQYVKQTTSYYQPKQDINDFPSVTTKYIKVSMSKDQDRKYRVASGKVNKADLALLKKGTEVTRNTASFNAFLNATRQISNTWDGALNTPKLNQVLETVIKGPKPALVYSNWINNGIKPLASMLQKKNISYLEFTGNMTDIKKKKVVSDYNNGKIEVLLLSSSGGEGLDLKNTRQIHIMEPHWNIAKISQVIGRGIRYKSHESLPHSQRKVIVYHWIAVPLNSKKDMGTDEYLYKLSKEKMKEMEAFLETVIKTSIELYSNKKSTGTIKLLKKHKNTLKKQLGGCQYISMYNMLYA